MLPVTKQTWSIYPKSASEARAFLERRATLNQATNAAQMILSSYPQSVNPVNAECYATQIVALLASYPPEIVSRLAEPVNGVVGKLQWLPSVAELKKEADALLRYAQIRSVEDVAWTESRPYVAAKVDNWKKLKVPEIVKGKGIDVKDG